MRVKNNTVTINGRTYDAKTGVALSTATASKINQKPVKVSSPAKKIAVKTSADETTTTPVRSIRTASSSRHQPQRSQTLRRTLVKKPTAPTPTHAVAGLTSQPKKIIISDGTATKSKPVILAHRQSPSISKFGTRSQLSQRVTHVPVAKAPTAHKTTRHYDINDTPPTTAHAKLSTPLKELHHDLFETALQGATTHKAKRLKKPRHHNRALRIGASALTVLLLVAFFGYQNMPSMALKRASSTIGFNARIPGYSPAGYKLSGPVEYKAGNVTLSFRSTTDSRSYTVTQTATDLDNQALAASFLNGKSYQKVTANGQPGYIYDDSNITWVNNGVWYNVASDSRLSSDQLINIASSLL